MGIDILNQRLEKFNISLNEKQLQQFEMYYQMLIEKNKVMNLTAITDFEEVIDKHFVDSLALGMMTDLTKEKSIIDIGTGAGFPGIPLKIMYPNLKVTLLDSLNKRILFLKDVVNQLKLENVECIHGRAEELGQKVNYREQYDFCVSRAVANLSTLSEYCVPFVKVSGAFVPYKSGKIEQEVKEAKFALQKLGACVKTTKMFNLPGTDIERSLVWIEKTKHTPKAYPRKAGKPAKEPLGHVVEK